LGETAERPDAGREVVQTGEVFEVAAVATEQDLTQVLEAVDGRRGLPGPADVISRAAEECAEFYIGHVTA
jgi:hypothetical protein